jgi:DNA repair protein RecO (recombination protein O)
MRQELIVRGIVLGTSLVGEYDKRLVLLTPELGKITVFANGARRPNSRFAAASQSFTMGRYTLREGHNAYNLSAVEIEESFLALSYDMEKMCYASYLCELTSYYTHDGVRAADELNLLYVSFRTLLEDRIPPKLVKSIFELKLMDIEGQGIHASDCVKCGSREGLHLIDAYSGGLICRACEKKAKRPRTISEGAIYTLRYILSASIDRLYTFQLSEEMYKEVSDVITLFVEEYVDRKFNSLNILAGLS